MDIRRATAQDAAAIVDVANASWLWAYAHIIPEVDMASRLDAERVERIGRSLTEDHFTLVAEIEGAVVGFASVDEPCHLPGADWEIGGLYVHPLAARRGIGRTLLAEAVKEGLRRGRSRLAIHTLRDNVIGRAFYEKLGGVLAHEDTWVFRDKPYPAVWYVFEDMAGMAGG